MDNILFFKKAAALRDFFASVNAEDLRQAVTVISHFFDLPVKQETDWQEVEYDFNRLFVGPATVLAPPYASAYQQEPSLMGKPALEVREAYRALGLEVPDKNATPDDHIAFELDAVVALGFAESQEDELERVHAWLVGEHLNGWIPQFAASVRKQSDVSEVVQLVIGALTSWLESAEIKPEYIVSEMKLSTRLGG